MAELLTGAGSRPRGRLALQKCLTRFSKAFTQGLHRTHGLGCLSVGRRNVLRNTSWEAHLMIYLFNAPANVFTQFPMGLKCSFDPTHFAWKWLICTATITDRKWVLGFG